MKPGRWYTRNISRGFGVSDESYATKEKAQKAANYRARTEGCQIVVEFYETDNQGNFKRVIK
tara:strand:- start:352 stop:537 length:186 start_codon:yes stop_codon:yes gene_type:complete